ncbi:MAG: TlpA family protein disulfide reductase [Chloroflexi bacterium]|nr:TlpA family protein disulfide reductase [Chloroflexota bacterium]
MVNLKAASNQAANGMAMMNDQIIKERRRTSWLILGGWLIMGLGMGLLFLPKPLLPQNWVETVAPETAASTSIQPAANVSLPQPLPRPNLTDTVILKVATPTGNPVVLSDSGKSDPVVGQLAPDFILKTLAGDQITLSSLRGQPVLLNFWASWCPPCRLEMPDLVRVYETRRAEGLVILGVNVTFQDSTSGAQAFVDEFKINFPTLLDETGQVTTDLYGIRGLPTSVFINPEGLITRINLGPMTGGQMDEFIGEIVE